MPAKSDGMSRPFGVTILALLQLITGLSNVFTGLIAMGASSDLGLTEAAKNLFFLVGLVLFILGVSSLWLARAYMKGFEWARGRGRTIAVLAILFVFLILFLNLPKKFGPDNPGLSIIWNALVFIYLGRPKIVAYFAGRVGGRTWSQPSKTRR